MTALHPDRPRRKLPVVLALVVLLVIALGAAAIINRARLEGEPPRVQVSPEGDVVGTAPLEITVADAGAGLKSLSVTLAIAGTETPVASEQFAQPVAEKKVSLALAKVAGIKEGPVTLKIVARDASLRRWFAGNEVKFEKPLTVDLTPPVLQVVADDRYINLGGVGALVYRTSPDTVTSGVRIGRHFFPGFAGQVKDRPDHFFVLFAHPYNLQGSVRPVLVATDKAGNSREVGVTYELKGVSYRKSTLTVSESFIVNKVAPLLQDAAARQGAPKDVFVAVNEKLRRENEERILAVTSKASPEMLWKGAFLQLSNSKVEANFADHRTYVYNGERISTSYHLGYDLSVTKRYPVEAANAGTVAFAGDLGIYGNTVILDHGLGLFTLYSHLSSIDVKEGDRVERKGILGRTGETGLAGGDHLHYGVYLHGVPVLPVEWWDAKWIRDNIEPKLGG